MQAKPYTYAYRTNITKHSYCIIQLLHWDHQKWKSNCIVSTLVVSKHAHEFNHVYQSLTYNSPSGRNVFDNDIIILIKSIRTSSQWNLETFEMFITPPKNICVKGLSYMITMHEEYMVNYGIWINIINNLRNPSHEPTNLFWFFHKYVFNVKRALYEDNINILFVVLIAISICPLG